MRLCVLGALELVGTGATSGPGVAPDTAPVLSPRLRRVLAGLLVRANAVVSVDWLADVVWGDNPPANADASMHNLVSRLRTALRADAGPVLLTRAPGYLLRIAPGDLDASRFEQLTAEARAHLKADPQRAAAMLDEALDLWRGPAYAEYADEEFARAEATRLEEARTTAREDRVEAALLLGADDDAVRRLEAVLAENPLRERPHGQLMRALYRSGRQADALATYRRFRRRLDEELGLEPSPDLNLLETRVLRQDPSLGRHTVPVADLPGNLPGVPPRLLGRDDELAQISELLARVRLLTLTGAGGIGKTSLALRTAVDHLDLGASKGYVDGGWLVELAPVSDPAAVADAVTTALSVQQRQGLGVERRLVEFLHTKRLLLVLDNCEHVVAAVAELVHAIGRGCRDVTILATSREPLGVEGEHVHSVPPLAVPATGRLELGAVAGTPSVALFLERAEAAAPGFVLRAGNAAAIAEICRRLDGAPLAIELAAARMRSMTPAEVVARLSARFHFLRSSRRISAERHRTLHAVVDWSYQLLDDRERRAFDRLSVFAGDFTLAAAERLLRDEAPEAEVADLLGGLVDRSMVLASPDEDGTTRFTLLETIRAYGQERLAERGEVEPARRAHAHAYVDLAEEVAPRLYGPGRRRWADAISRSFGDLRLAHRWAMEHDHDLAVRLVAALFDYGEMRMPPEVFAWAERSVRGRAHSPHDAMAWACAATGARFSGDLDRAERLAEHGLEAAGPDHPVRRFPLHVLCEVELFRGRLGEVERLSTEAERWGAEVGDHHHTGLATIIRALARAYSGDPDSARSLAERVRRDAQAHDDVGLVGWAVYVAGEVQIDTRPDAAAALLAEALSYAQTVDDRYLVGVALVSIASVRSRHGDPRRALEVFRDVIAHWDQASSWTQQWTTLRNVVELLARVGAREEATILLGAAGNRTTSGPLFGPDADRLRRTAGVLSDQLTPTRFAALHADGSAMSDADVVTWVGDTLDRLAAT